MREEGTPASAGSTYISYAVVAGLCQGMVCADCRLLLTATSVEGQANFCCFIATSVEVTSNCYCFSGCVGRSLPVVVCAHTNFSASTHGCGMGSYQQAGRCQDCSLRPRWWWSRLYVMVHSRVLLGVSAPSYSMQVIVGSISHLQCRIFIFSFSQFKRPRCVGPLWGILSQCGAAGAPNMGGFP